MHDNIYHHSDSCHLPDLGKFFEGKLHPEGLLKDRRRRRVSKRMRIIQYKSINKTCVIAVKSMMDRQVLLNPDYTQGYAHGMGEFLI